MTESSDSLTPGAMDALKRLVGGDTLSREKNRSAVRWRNGGSLHHKSFAKLEEAGVLKSVKGEPGFDSWESNAKGRTLVEKAEKAGKPAPAKPARKAASSKSKPKK